ncbi:MAG TPA: ABC transporter ATP-binding protein [Candidatus Polarisedimenticolia bacterium]|nr:ABC transporter ATP-binding protein [Candidatus Polarisedimenticolia bacterium]
MMPSPIETHHLGRRFRRRRSLGQLFSGAKKPLETWALRDVSLEVAEKSIFGLLGPNGAGKTTLLKILSGLILPTEGTARVGGHDVAHAEAAVKRLLGYVSSDERSFFWRLTGRQNLAFFGSLYEGHGEALRERIQYLLARLELTGQGDQPFGEYSSGMKQRLSLARALLHDPPIMLLDEPTRSLDPISAKHLRRFIGEELNGRDGKTLVLATHNLQEAEQLCSKVAVLSRGKVLGSGSIEEMPAWGQGKESYVLVLSGIAGIPEEVQDGLVLTPLPGGRLRVAGEFGRDGAKLSALLEAVLRLRGRIVSCSRTESTLQQVFDRIEEGQG